MNGNDDLNSYVKATEEIVENFKCLKTKSNHLNQEIMKSFEEKKLRFADKRKVRDNEFKSLRNK